MKEVFFKLPAASKAPTLKAVGKMCPCAMVRLVSCCCSRRGFAPKQPRIHKALTVESAAGDPVTATVVHPARAGRLRIPKGARLVGRVLRCESEFTALIAPHTQIVFEFFRLEFADSRLDFRGRVKEYGRQRGLPEYRAPSPKGWLHSASFVFGGYLLGLPAGFQMKWESAAVAP